ncbi:MAG: SdrD B-like domain-containing protein [Fuerstiella sp.]|nr:SdrD B-like domain-containing protein [Fuerstiella sp.]
MTTEVLEARCLLAASTFTPEEQLLLELVNRSRADPVAEAARQGIALNQGLPPETISAAPKPPLAGNNLLGTVADGHTGDMMPRGFFAHDSPAAGSTTPSDRINQSGYPWTNSGENLAIQPYAALAPGVVTNQMHGVLFKSLLGHRQALLNDVYFETGIGIEFGAFNDTNNIFGSGVGVVHNVGLATEVFGTQPGSPAYHEDLSLLYDAAPAEFTTYTLLGGQQHDDVNFGNVNVAIPGSIHGRKWNDLNGDGQRSSDEAWLNGWEIELVNTDGTVVQTATTVDMDVNGQTESGWYWFNEVDPGDWTVRELMQDGWHQTSPGDPLSVSAYQLDTELGFRETGSGFQNWGGLGEKWLLADGNVWHFMTPDGALNQWDGSARDSLTGTLVDTLSPAYHADPSLVYDAQNPFNALVTVGPGDEVTDVNFGNQEDAALGSDPTDFAGVGNVAARVSGNDLILTGDNASNGVMVSTKPGRMDHRDRTW